MGDIVNLKLHRKRQARAEKESEAGINRAKFGRPKAERKLSAAKRDLETKRLNDHKIDE